MQKYPSDAIPELVTDAQREEIDNLAKAVWMRAYEIGAKLGGAEGLVVESVSIILVSHAVRALVHNLQRMNPLYASLVLHNLTEEKAQDITEFLDELRMAARKKGIEI